MNNYKILCQIGDAVVFIIGGKFEKADLTDLNNEEILNRIYRIQFKNPPKNVVLEQVLLAIQKRPEIALRFYGDYSEDLIDWGKLSEIQKLQIDLWNIVSLKEVSRLVNLRELGITKNVSSKVSLSILEPLCNLKVLYTSVSTDIETIGDLTELNKISLREVKNNNLDFLRGLNRLKTLYISLGSYKDFNGLAKINSLEKLNIHQVGGFNDDVTENVLAHCNAIWALKLENLKHITRLDFVKGLQRLKYVSFEGLQNLETYNPFLENKSVESLAGYNCRPTDKSLSGLKNLKNIRLGDSYSKSELDEFLTISNATNINFRGKVLRGGAQIENPFYP